MASQSLYRKWRSQTFDELVGQEHVIQTLRNAIVEERVAHAYLFTGPRGVGKTSMARLLSKAVNCLDPAPARRPCGTCTACVSIAEGRAVDVIEMDAASNTSVEDARELIERVQFRPAELRTKVYVIDECFRYEEPVTLADGTRVPIGKIVEEGWKAEVLSYNEQTGQIEPKLILRHMCKPPSLPMVRVTLNNNRAIVCTLSHKFYTPQGLLRAGELAPGQFVYANFERVTKHQSEVVAGAAIGDGHIAITDSQMRARLSITQSVAQKPYLDYKAQLLGDLVQTAPAFYHAARSFSKTGIYRLLTVSRPQFARLYRELYDQTGRECVTVEYLSRITALGLALWYLDDGSLVTAHHRYTRRDGSVADYPATRSMLSVYGFTCEESRLICSWLYDQWGVEARTSATAKGPQIWLTLAGTNQLHKVIAQYVPPSMEYKLLPPYRAGFRPPVDDLQLSDLAVSVVRKVEPVSSPQYVYNIEVADNHNYFVRDILVSNCHMLSTAAFNALLKTLEEPPAHAIFILATTEVHKVPATILSRCQRFTFTRHGIVSTAAHLRRVAEAETLVLAEGVPEAIARAATGSMRDALGVLEQLASFTNGAITLEQVHSLLGMTAAAEVYALIEALLGADVGAALRAVAGVADQGADLRQFTRDLVEHLRSLLLLLASGDQALADTGADEFAMMAAWAQRAEAPRLLHWLKLFSGLDYQLRTSPYGHLPLELAVVEALVQSPPPAPSSPPHPARPVQPASPARPPARPTAAPPPPSPRPVPPEAVAPPVAPAAPPEAVAPPVAPAAPPEPVAPEPVVPAPPEPVAPEPVAPPTNPAPPESMVPPGSATMPTTTAPPPREAAPTLFPLPVVTHAPRSAAEAAAANADFSALERVETLWEAIKRDVRPKSPTVQALLHSVRPIDVEGHTVVLLASSSFHKDSLDKAPNRRIVEDVLKKHLGASFAIRCTIEARDESLDLRGQIREARKDELVRAAINIFDAHIIDIEPEE